MGGLGGPGGLGGLDAARAAVRKWAVANFRRARSRGRADAASFRLWRKEVREGRLVHGAEARFSSHALENERESRRVLGTLPAFTWSETAPSVGVCGAEARGGVTEV